MEGIVPLIIIIIVFNLFNALIRAARKGKQPVQQTALQKVLVSSAGPPSEETESVWKDDDIYSSSDLSAEPLYAEPVHTGSEGYKPLESVKRESARPPLQKVELSPSQGDDRGASLGAELQQILTKKEPLVAAFIFHEILSPPPALRRKHR